MCAAGHAASLDRNGDRASERSATGARRQPCPGDSFPALHNPDKDKSTRVTNTTLISVTTKLKARRWRRTPSSNRSREAMCKPREITATGGRMREPSRRRCSTLAAPGGPARPPWLNARQVMTAQRASAKGSDVSCLLGCARSRSRASETVAARMQETTGGDPLHLCT